MNSFFLVAVLSIGLTFGIQSAYAETVQGVNYNAQVTANPDGSQTVNWESIPYERLPVDGKYQDYVFTDLGYALEIRTGSSKIQLDTSSCSFEFFSKEGSSLFVDSLVSYNSIVDLYEWNEVSQINNATCEAYHDSSNHSLVAKRYAAGIGFIEYKYIFDEGKWKTQLEATNLTSLTNRVFAFDQTIDLNRDTISFGGSQKNLDNFDGVTFDRTFLENNEAKVIDFLNNYNFDLDIAFDYLDSVTVFDTGADSSKIVFHYMRNNDILLPNETLIIDPTFGYTAANGYVFRMSDNGATTACSTTGQDIQTAVIQVYFRDSDNAGFSCYNGAFEWDISSIPGNAIIDDVTVRYDVDVVYPVTTPNDIVLLTLQPSTYSSSAANAKTLYDAVNAAATVYSDENTNFETAANDYTTDLGSTADSDVEDTYLALGWYSVAIRADGQIRETAGDKGSYVDISGASSWDLQITYHIPPPPDSITDLTLDSVTDTTANLSFTAPGLNGETLQNYTLRLDTPQTDTVTTFNQNTTSVFFNVTGLVTGTGYSGQASAGTIGGYNFTLANILNFTTLEYPDGTLSIVTGNVGDTLAVNGTATITNGTLPIEIDTMLLYEDNVLVKSESISETVSSLPDVVSLETLWYRITDDASHEYHMKIQATNSIGSNNTDSSTNSTVTREYDPAYLPAVDNPSTQGDVNATISRFDSQDGILLKVNRISVSTGDIWQIECIAQTNSEAASTKDENESWSGTWSNLTGTGYFNTTFTGFTNSHAYITCFNEDELFTLTDFTDSSLALLGIALFDESYGSMLGVPVGIFFLVMTAGMATKRTAPTFIILITGIAGTMATIGFFSFEPLVWGLALVTAMLGIFVNQKIF